jgi:DNA polymerase-3 subunit epsilon
MNKINLNLNFKRPIVFFDIESTGLNVNSDRIVSISLIKIHQDGTIEAKSALLNPQIPIPKEATSIHGIKDEDVANCPTFKEISKSLYNFLKGCDLAGYNITSFDNLILFEEFLRSDIEFPDDDVKFIDVFNIFRKMEQRNLSAAYKFYCGKELLGAHSSDSDVIACLEVFAAQLNRYEELKNKTIDEISQFSKMDNRVDLAGRIVLNENGEYVYNFGKFKNTRIIDNISYAEWMLNSDFPTNTKIVLKKILSKLKSDNPEDSLVF